MQATHVEDCDSLALDVDGVLHLVQFDHRRLDGLLQREYSRQEFGACLAVQQSRCDGELCDLVVIN